MDPSAAPSLSIASLPRKAVVIGFGTKLLLGRFSCNEGFLSNNTSGANYEPTGPVALTSPTVEQPLSTVLIEDGQLVRAVAFLHIPDGPLCIVSAGDSKFINVYNVSSWREHNPDAAVDSDDEEENAPIEANPATDTSTPAPTAERGAVAPQQWTPSFRYGPHTKRITHVATTNDGSIVFADKFGEVHQIRLAWSPSHTIEVDGDEKTPATFLLQHFSIMSTLFLTSPVPRRDPVASTEERSNVACRHLFSCDKDCHTRVSRYPETYVVEQFLWARGTEQAVVTSVAEIPLLAEEAAHGAREDGEKADKRFNPPYSYYATGDSKGRVHFWAASTTASVYAPEPVFQLITSYTPQLLSGEAEAGAVVAITYVTVTHDDDGRPLHPRDCPRGVLVAFTNLTDVVFLPLFDNMGKYRLHVAQVGATRTHLAARPLAMVGSNECTALVLQRDGRVVFLQLSGLGSVVEERRSGGDAKICDFNANVTVGVTFAEESMPRLETTLQKVASDAAVSLDTLDLTAQWRYDAVDPRTRKGRQRDGDGDGDGDSADDGEEDDDTAEGKDTAAVSPQGRKKARKETA